MPGLLDIGNFFFADHNNPGCHSLCHRLRYKTILGLQAEVRIITIAVYHPISLQLCLFHCRVSIRAGPYCWDRRF